MDKQKIIEKTAEYAKQNLSGFDSAHDWWHTYRVWQLAKKISKQENADLFVVELGALFHDIADYKFYAGDEEIGPLRARQFLSSLKVEPDIIDQVDKIIRNVSFKGKNHKQAFRSPELDVVQDADRLDALGAIGIARVFNFGGYVKKAIYDPNIKPHPDMTVEEYKKGETPSINHFYEKLLLLKDRMNTKTGKKLAEHRHQFMQEYLKEFFEELDGKN